MTLESSAPLSLDTVTQEARSEWAMWPLPNYCWAMRLVYLVVIRLVLLPAENGLGLLSYRMEPYCRAATCVLQVSKATCRASALRASLCLRCWLGNGPLSLVANTLVLLAASHKPGSCPALVGSVMGFSLQRSEKLR